MVLGGVLAAAVGPETARHARYMLSVQYAGCFVVLCILYAVQFVLLACLDYKLLARLSEAPVRSVGDKSGSGAVNGISGTASQPSAQRVRSLQPAHSMLFKPAATGFLRSVSSKVLGRGAAGQPALRGDGQALVEDVEEARPAQVEEAQDELDLQQEKEQLGKQGEQQQPAQAQAPPPVLGASTLAAEPEPEPRLSELVLSWRFVLPAAACGLSFCGMAALMSGTPLAVAAAGYSYDTGVWVVEAHIVAMYLPGLVTADLITVGGAGLDCLDGWKDGRRGLWVGVLQSCGRILAPHNPPAPDVTPTPNC